MTAGPASRPLPALPSPAWVGMLFFVGAEAMLFGGLLIAFLIFRLGSPVWPPLGEPRLPLGVTLANTAILVASGVVMRRAVARARAGAGAEARRALATTAALGVTFLTVQGSEWVRLVRWGLTATSSPYGGIVYALLAAHGVHVLAAVAWLVAVAVPGRRPPPPARRLEACALYWSFVCILWVAIVAVVYLG
ncbi:MAG: cytochrome c oxidase subunit 3 [Candidatus Rokubacteria bacterium]|nr:cytochrome c oxidase subunit 3 [Candidatus Rokubacteria bacterium]